MKKIIFAIMAMFVTISISAQQQRGERREMNVEDMATRQAKEVKEACTTTDEQYTAIYNLYLTQAKEMKAQRDSLQKTSSSSERPKMDMSAMKARQEKVDAQIKAILTADQYTAYEKMQKNRQNRRGGQGGAREQKSE